MIPSTFHEVAWSLALAVTALIAFFRGARPEVLGITGVMIAYLITALASSPIAHIPTGVRWAVVFANSETLAVALYVMWRSSRWWPLFSVAFQAISLIFYLVPMFDPAMRARAYHFSSVAFDYLNLLTIALGALLEGPRPWRMRSAVEG